MRIPRDLVPQLPGVLWFFQMGVIFFWAVDESPGQTRTAQLLDLAAKSVVFLIRVSTLPLMRPLRKTALLEAAVIQWFWLKDCFPEAQQFNSIHDDRSRLMIFKAVKAADECRFSRT